MNRIKNLDGLWQNKVHKVEAIFHYYYSYFLKSCDITGIDDVLEAIDSALDIHSSSSLIDPFSSEEVLVTLKQMHPKKFIGVNGMFTLFFKDISTLLAQISLLLCLIF